MFRPERNFQVIKYAPKIPKEEVVQIKREKTEAVPNTNVNNTCDIDVDIAEPTKGEEVIDLINCDHWADVAVTAESDEENEQKKCHTKEYPKPKKTKPQQKWYVCHLCNYQSQGEDLLIKHMIRKHTSIDEDYFVCGFCTYKYQSEEELQSHLIKHIPEKQVVDDSWKWKFVINDFQNIRSRRLRKEETAVLEETFKKHQYLKGEISLKLAKKLNVDVERIRRWFRSRRRSTRRE